MIYEDVYMLKDVSVIIIGELTPLLREWSGIINDEIEKTVEKIHNLIQVQHCLIKYNKEVIDKIKEDLYHKEEN